MAYSINLTNNDVLITLEDGTSDNTFTSLTLFGKNFSGYGELLNENFVHLLENAASTLAPVTPLNGQLWYNSSTKTMNWWNSTSWKTIADTALIPSTTLKSYNLIGGTAGQISYQTAANTTAFFGPGIAGQVLTSSGASVPVFTSTLAITTLTATGDITAYYSDDRLKTRIGNIENALDKVSQLNGFHYTANELAESLGYTVKPEVGVSAQEVMKVLPEIVVPAPIDPQYFTIHYEKLIPLLIEAIKELKNEIDILKKG